MKIIIDGHECLVPAEEETLLLQQFQVIALYEYSKFGQDIRFLLKPLARHQLKKFEDEARNKFGKEPSMKFRPGKGIDPVIHFSSILSMIIQEMMQHVTFTITTNDHTIAALSFAVESEGEGGGQMAIDGNIGLWQNNQPEIH